MYNWSVDIAKLKKHPKEFKIWKLEQLINFGLGKEKLDKSEVKKNLKNLRVDPNKKKFLKFIFG